MSVFTSLVQKQIDIPHDPPNHVLIRKLAPKHLEAAARVQQSKALAQMRDIGGELMREIEALTPGTVTAALKSDPLMAFDRPTLIANGVLNSSYGRDLTKLDIAEDLDDETQEFLAREVLKLAKPSLFQTEEVAADERKNDSAGSIAF